MGQNQDAAIGMLDSGLGGLTVLREAARQMPGEHFIYYADFLHSPFGGRSKAELAGILNKAVSELTDRGVKALVLASNTATSAAVEVFRSTLKLPVIGLEPALKPAVELTPEGEILVLATELTLREEKFNLLYESFKGRGGIILKSCPGLVELIDAGRETGVELESFLSTLFSQLDREAVRTVVLGCTHYVIIRREIMAHFPKALRCLDGNEGAVRRLADVLKRENAVNPSTVPGRIEFLSSDPVKLPLLEKKYRHLSLDGSESGYGEHATKD